MLQVVRLTLRMTATALAKGVLGPSVAVPAEGSVEEEAFILAFLTTTPDFEQYKQQ